LNPFLLLGTFFCITSSKVLSELRRAEAILKYDIKTITTANWVRVWVRVIHCVINAHAKWSIQNNPAIFK